MNFIFFSTYIKKLYKLKIQELLFDSEIDEFVNSESNEDLSSYSSVDEDDYYYQYFIKKNVLEKCLLGKNNLCFIIQDINKNYYGMYFPGDITGDYNVCMNVKFFILTKGIEIKEINYNSNRIFTSIIFSNDDYLIQVGENDEWLFKLYKDHIEFNCNQKLINNFNKTIMKTSKIQKFYVFKLN